MEYLNPKNDVAFKKNFGSEKNKDVLINFLQTSLNLNNILVAGDVMLDRYWFGEVNRISPEAPVPIARIKKTEERAGGAANVARNIANLGGSVSLISTVGDDEAGLELTTILKNDNIDVRFKTDTDFKTTVKLRVLGQNQQLIRIDFEEEPSHEILLQNLEEFKHLAQTSPVIILSDYGKGGLRHTEEMIKIATLNNAITIIDPKGHDYSIYKNATLITPNKKELELVVGKWKSEDELKQKALNLKQELNLKYLLLTRSEEGMTLFIDNEAFNYPTVTKEVFDVSGAGDTVVATLALMLANNLPIKEAVSISNLAAGIVVGKIGTATISIDELIEKLHQH